MDKNNENNFSLPIYHRNKYLSKYVTSYIKAGPLFLTLQTKVVQVNIADFSTSIFTTHLHSNVDCLFLNSTKAELLQVGLFLHSIYLPENFF